MSISTGGLPGTDRVPHALRPRFGGDDMALIQLIVLLIVIGVLLWAVNTYLPIDPPIKAIINVVVLIAVCLWLLAAFGLLPGTTIRISP
jgi:hypothetical protein